MKKPFFLMLKGTAPRSVWCTPLFNGYRWMLLMLLALSGCGAPDRIADGGTPASTHTIVQTVSMIPTLTSPATELTVSPAYPIEVTTQPSAQPSSTVLVSTPTILAPSNDETSTIVMPAPSTIASTPNPSSPATVPRLVFQSNGKDRGQSGLYIINADGTHLTRLTDSPLDRAPNWSPDGQRIVFSSDRDTHSNPDIYIINADGTGFARLASDSAFDDTPIWSPDGRSIAFTSNRGSKTPYGDIYVMQPDGTQVRRLTSGPSFENIIGWSSDSTRIFYSGPNQDGLWAISAVDLDSVQSNVIVEGATGEISPDGRSIAFIRVDAGQGDIWISSIDGTNVRRLTKTSATEYFPGWSPDGKRIAFGSLVDGPAVFVINTDGTGQTQVSAPKTGTGELHWSPDGTYIAFRVKTAERMDLAVVDVAQGTQTIITQNMGVEAGFAWAPR
jgi:TolB protein